jgi:hypothetical protein
LNRGGLRNFEVGIAQKSKLIALTLTSVQQLTLRRMYSRTSRGNLLVYSDVEELCTAVRLRADYDSRRLELCIHKIAVLSLTLVAVI